MVIASESYRMSAVGNGATTTFPCTFRIDDDDEVTVFTLTAAGVLTTLTKTTHYTIDPTQIGDDDGFDIETVLPVADGTAIAAIRNVPLTQTVDLQSQGTISRAGLEEALDRLVMMIQQLAEENTRTLKITPAAVVDADLTQLVPEAGKVIAWNDAGDGLENVDPGTVALATPASNSVTTPTILDDAVTNAKAANMATQTIKGRNTAGTGDPEDLAVATVKTMLALNPDGSTIETSGSTIRVKDAGITEDKIASLAINYAHLNDAVRLSLGNINALINGNGWVAQRPVYTASVSGTYAYGKCDRWAGKITGSTVAGTLTQGTDCTITGTGGFAIRWSAITTTGSGIVYFRQRIEAKNTLKYLSRDLMFNCWMITDLGATSSVTIAIKHATATDDFSSTTTLQTSSAILVPTATATNVYTTFTAIDAANDNGLEIEIAVTVGAVTNKFVDLSLAMLWPAEGASPNSYEYLQWMIQYTQCQRYYWKTFPYATAPAQATSSYVGAIYQRVQGATPTATRSVMVYFPVQMRTLPTVTFYSTHQSSDNWYSLTDSNASGASTVAGNLSTNGFAANNGGDAGDGESEAVVIHATAEAEL